MHVVGDDKFGEVDRGRMYGWSVRIRWFVDLAENEADSLRNNMTVMKTRIDILHYGKDKATLIEVETRRKHDNCAVCMVHVPEKGEPIVHYPPWDPL